METASSYSKETLPNPVIVLILSASKTTASVSKQANFASHPAFVETAKIQKLTKLKLNSQGP
jgi:hypothetical protein